MITAQFEKFYEVKNLKKLHKSETRQAATCAWAINSQHLGMVPCCLCTGQITQKDLCTILSHFAIRNTITIDAAVS